MGDVGEGSWRGVMKLCSKLGRIKDVITKCDMIQRWENSRIIIWSVCIVYVLSITLLMAYVYMLYGVVAPFAVLFVSMALLQPYKIAYEYYSTRRKLDLSLAIRITNCWTIYQILNMILFTGGLFAYMIMLAEIEALHIPKSVWLIAVVILACVWSIKTIQPFVRKEKYEGKKRRPSNLISSFAPRFVILYTFVVYYFIACFDTIETNFIPTLCVIYLGVDRLMTMFNTIREYEQQEYYSMFRDTVRWIRETNEPE